MFAKYVTSSVLLAALCVPHALGAVVSLYIPDSDGESNDTPYTADPIGTDKSGHTTWRIGVGASSGTLTATQTTSSFTMVAGATDLHISAMGANGTSFREDCAMATHTASGGVVSASCAGQLADETSAFIIEDFDVSITPVPVQVSDHFDFKANNGGSLRMSMGGVGVSALAILGTAGVMLMRM